MKIQMDEGGEETVDVRKMLRAAMADDERTARRCLDGGLHPDAHDDDCVTALQIAAAVDHLRIMELLLRRGASVDFCNDLGFTPFLHACRNGNMRAVELLHSFHADHSRTTFYGSNAMALASAGGHIEVVAWLQRHSGRTLRNAPSPLIAAVAKRKFEVVVFCEILRHSPREFDGCCFFGLDAVRTAELLRDREMCSLLADLGLVSRLPAPRWPFFTESALVPAFSSYVKVNSDLLPDVRCLIRDQKVYQVARMLRMNRKFAPLPEGTTALMFAAVSGNVQMAQLFCKNGACLNASVCGFTSLMIAVVCGNDRMVRYLLQGGVHKETEGRVSLSQLASCSAGISQSTKDLIERMLLPSPSPPKTLFEKLANFFHRNGVQKVRVETDAPVHVQSSLVGFTDRVAWSMGRQSSLVPRRLFALLSFPPPFSLSPLHSSFRCNSTNDLISLKLNRILNRFTPDEVERLFKACTDTTPLAKRRCLSQSEIGDYLTSSSSSQNYSLSMDSDERCSRTISELRGRMFRFCGPHSQRNWSRRALSAQMEARQRQVVNFEANGDEKNARLWGLLRSEFSEFICEVLRKEEVDFDSFLMLATQDLIAMGISTDDSQRLVRLGVQLNSRRVVYL